MEKTKHPLIEAILKEKKITDFLESRGIHPTRKSGDRLVYLCPIHKGDSIPSFIVSNDRKEYQTYKCFGCHSGNDIINLVCDLDNVSIKQAIRILSKGISVEQGDITDSFVSESAKIIERELKDSKELEISMLKTGVFCRDHLSKWYDEEEVEFCLNMYKILDKVIRLNDIEDLERMYKILCEKGFPERRKFCLERKEKRILNKVKAWKI